MSKETTKLSIMTPEERILYLSKKKHVKSEFSQFFFENMRGDDGKTPEKGVDYYTEKEKQELLKAATPIKGQHYFTPQEIREFAQYVTPKKGVHYFDGKDGMKGDRGEKGETGEKGDIGESVDEKKIIKEITDYIIKNAKKDLVPLTLPEVMKHIKKEKLEMKDIKNMPLNMNDMRWHGSGLSTVSTDATLTGNGTPTNPLSVVGGGSTFVIGELVSGSGTVFTLANMPVAGTVAVYAIGQRQYLYNAVTNPTGNYTIVGEIITFVDGTTWNANQILADYQI